VGRWTAVAALLAGFVTAILLGAILLPGPCDRSLPSPEASSSTPRPAPLPGPLVGEPTEMAPSTEEQPDEAAQGGNWVLNREIHEQILAELPENSQVPYLSIRILRLANHTLAQFPPGELRGEAKRRVAELRQRLAERKLATRGDLEAMDALRIDLHRTDRELEQWRERVLDGEAILPEVDL
jgi:hypothetical protein